MLNHHSNAISPLVKVTDLCKYFGSYQAIDNVSLDIAAGEKVAIIGSSGSGKTTLLRCIAHLEKPSSGEIVVAGRHVGDRVVDGRRVAMSDREIADIRTGIGMVFQRFNLFPHLTAIENIMLGPLKVLRRSREEVEPIARDLLQKVGLPHKAGSYPDHLSGGQQQRIAIARSLAMKPKLMLFDEATSALDPELVGEVLHVIRQLAEEGMTMLIVTHEMSFAEEVADRIVVMDHGVIVDEGAPDVLVSSPSHPRTLALLRPNRERRPLSQVGSV
ncbi:polar amino acid transport system ATP-binding protein [Bosea sp. BE271]|uniref:amino acid ABC transporter ATP-binding protein n=1 Tax=Bosea TaxID=85413 RepID=UPI002865D90E|nr:MULTISPECIES: amino acid ABC transporter ATP-binding protein [Bosea]MDR6827665.1 polar amino acid transport system ATP-binding protein [Bosea robiniae]MDR6894641.1 polar amino acid transport system ATP-binding protein [Bosea sp. BE109]MDR7137771.1 polar amino acid transport system ATP-binding protein [Bosea sp. BE168]MDR7174470.1 polar amino acid transport system ATP-binding protein [Bosea sp. BE271]